MTGASRVPGSGAAALGRACDRPRRGKAIARRRSRRCDRPTRSSAGSRSERGAIDAARPGRAAGHLGRGRDRRVHLDRRTRRVELRATAVFAAARAVHGRDLGRHASRAVRSHGGPDHRRLELSIPLVRLAGLEPRWGAAGLGAAIGISGWIEFVLPRRGLDARLGTIRSPDFVPYLVTLWLIAALAGGAAWLVRLAVTEEGPILRAAVVLGVYGIAYLGITLAAGPREPRTTLSRLRSFVIR